MKWWIGFIAILISGEPFPGALAFWLAQKEVNGDGMRKLTDQEKVDAACGIRGLLRLLICAGRDAGAGDEYDGGSYAEDLRGLGKHLGLEIGPFQIGHNHGLAQKR